MVPELYMDETLEESLMLLQMDGINDSNVKRPGKVEEVMGDEPEEEEKDGGGWVVVETQRKSQEKPPVEVKSRTGRLQRMYPTLFSTTGERFLVGQEEMYGEAHVRRLRLDKAKLDRKPLKFARR